MRIGVDIDGVLCDFNQSFVRRCIMVTGRNLFPKWPFDIPTWNYPEHYGYTAEEVSRIWESVKADPTFWLTLQPYWDAPTVLQDLRLYSDTLQHEIYYITSRPGIATKHQSEVWLATYSGEFASNPTVLVSSRKDLCCKALRLDRYIDDYDVNILNCWHLNGRDTKLYLMDRPWNQQFNEEGIATRVSSVSEMFK